RSVVIVGAIESDLNTDGRMGRGGETYQERLQIAALLIACESRKMIGKEAENRFKTSIVPVTKTAGIRSRGFREDRLAIEIAKLRNFQRLRFTQQIRGDQGVAASSRKRMTVVASNGPAADGRAGEQCGPHRRTAGISGDRRWQAVGDGAVWLRRRRERVEE